MNSTEIAKRLAKISEYEQGMDLVRACDTRRQEIKSRLALILPRPAGSAISESVLRQQASLDGLEAILRLDTEARDLQAEQQHLGVLERLCHEAAQRCRTEAIREAATKAPKAVPRGIARVREALRALDAEMESLNRETMAINEALGLGDSALSFPFNDRECADLLQLREDIWRTRTVVCCIPPGLSPTSPGAYPLTAELAFMWHDSQAWGNRHGPQWPQRETRHPGPNKDMHRSFG